MGARRDAHLDEAAGRGAGHPLWDAPGVLITPHFAGDTREAERRAFALVGEQVRRYVRGDPLVNVVKGGY